MKHLFRCLLPVLISLPEIVAAQHYARKGLLDLRSLDFEGTSINLNGEWEVYMSELIEPAAFNNGPKAPKEYFDFPFLWNEFSKARKPGEGYATYHLKVLVNSPLKFAIEVPHFYSNYDFYINTQRVAFNGKVGISEKNSQPQWLPQTIDYNAITDTLNIVIQASNFHHAKGGVKKSIVFGDSEILHFKKKIAVASNIAMVASLALMTLAFIILYFFSKNKLSLLYFAGLCFTWCIRSMFSNQYIIISWFPWFPWELGVKIEYITLYAMMILAILFLGNIFKDDVSISFKFLFSICNGIFIFLTLLFKASFYTQFLPVYLSFCAMLLIYVIYVLLRALVYEREGAWLIISCVFLGVIIFSYDLIAYQGFATFNPIIINVGYLVMFLLMALCLLYHTGYLKRSANQSNMLTYEDLYGSSKATKR